MFNMSAAMANKFAEVADSFTERIKALGPALGGNSIPPAAEPLRQPPTIPHKSSEVDA